MPAKKYASKEERLKARREQRRKYEASDRGRSKAAERRSNRTPEQVELDREKQRQYDARRAESKRTYARERRAADPEASRQSARKSRARNRDKANEATRNWKAAHPEMVQASRRRRGDVIVDGDLTAAQWREQKAYYGILCAYCLRSGVPLEMDHVDPIARGGKHTMDNVAPACRSCNARKSDRSLLEFLLVMD